MMVPVSFAGDSKQVPPSNSKQTILFAEDNGQLRKSVAELLIRYGYDLIVASDGREALRKALAFAGTIHLLLSDVDMPGMTGIELAIQLNRERPDTKILLISGLPTRMLDLYNGWSFLPKPFMPGRQETGFGSVCVRKDR
jgi:two-component system cell cycle sensor histidine kinase/response regulator CckA